jgi:hypothetical protein
VSLENLASLDDPRLLAVARNVKAYEANEDLSGLVLELANRLGSYTRWQDVNTYSRTIGYLCNGDGYE